MRILVTGREGQVARSIAERAPADAEIIFAGRPALDLADPASIERAVAENAPDLIISAAAYTAVDKAEDEADLAMIVNGEAPGVLACAAAKIGARIIHLSTDYVFSGSSPNAYVEKDPVGPIGAYGKTKLAGEEAVRASGASCAILRTAWVYSPFGNNFVRTMLRLAADRDEVRVVADQFGCPTSALDIADAVFAAAANWQEGVFHLAGTGETNWADFARAIFAESGAQGGPTAIVTDIVTSAYPTRATRPSNSRLDSSLFTRTFGYRMPEWQASLPTVVDRLLANDASPRQLVD
mgnify:CR=1 FL=1